MKFTVTLKDPDGFYDGVTEAVERSFPKGLTFTEGKKPIGERRELVFEKIKKWVQRQEYITIEFDTETGTATVVPTLN